MSPFSPALEAVKYSWMNFGEFFYPHAELRGNSNKKPGIEAAWEDYTFDGIISVPYEALDSLEVSPDFRPWPVKPMEGGGVAGVLAVHYQTNCLNLIRKFIHRDTYDYTAEREFDPVITPPEKLRAQVHQCFEVLRQELVCHVDTSLYLLWPDPMQLSVYNEDNAERHKCRSYDGIKTWAEQHKLQGLHNATSYFKNLYYPLMVD
ncbi:hypothetical protein MMC25_003232 [Agyrium rufum]|nr:hypothetical protein [Agyrium rufum]